MSEQGEPGPWGTDSFAPVYQADFVCEKCGKLHPGLHFGPVVGPPGHCSPGWSGDEEKPDDFCDGWLQQASEETLIHPKPLPQDFLDLCEKQGISPHWPHFPADGIL